MTILLLKFTKQKWNNKNRFVNTIKPISFNVYLIHLPIVLSLAVLLGKFQLFSVLNVLIATVVVFFTTFLIAFVMHLVQFNSKK